MILFHKKERKQRNNYLLKSHVKYAHEEGLKCELCDMTFKSDGAIRYHMNVVHLNHRQTCDLCESFCLMPGRYNLLMLRAGGHNSLITIIFQ